MTSSSADRAQRLRQILERRFAPLELRIQDESHLHAGHAGAADGRGHFRIRIVAEAFRGVAPLARHRMVYGAVDELLRNDIHALAIEALPPGSGAAGVGPGPDFHNNPEYSQ
jgi:BolA protein